MLQLPQNLFDKIRQSRVVRAVTVSGGSIAAASAVDVTLPATGVDTGSYVAALVTALGGVMGTAIAAGFAIFAIWMGYKYVRKAIKGAG